MEFNNQQKVRENPWQQNNNEADGLIRIIAGILIAIFGLWFFVSFVPILIGLGELVGMLGGQFLYHNHVYWLAYFMILLAGIFVWNKRSVGYLLATGACGFLLGMRIVSSLFYFFQGADLANLLAGLTGLHFPFSIYTPVYFGMVVGLIFCLVQVNRSHVRLGLNVDNQSRTMALLLGLGLLVYGTFLMISADFIFPY